MAYGSDVDPSSFVVGKNCMAVICRTSGNSTMTHAVPLFSRRAYSIGQILTCLAVFYNIQDLTIFLASSIHALDQHWFTK